MIVFESRHARRFVGRLERGEDLVGSLRALAERERVKAAWVSATGLVEWAEVTDWDAEREAFRAPRRIEGPLTILSLSGNVSLRMSSPWVQLTAAFSRESDHGLVVVGGMLGACSSLACEIVMESFEDVRLERDEDASTGLSLFKGETQRGVVARASAVRVGAPSKRRAPSEEPADEPVEDAPLPPRAAPRAPELPVTVPIVKPAPAPSGGAPSWGQVAAVSASTPEDGGTEPELKKGDWVDHRQFGLCRVEGDDPDGGVIIRLPSGVRKVIRLDYLEVLPARFDGERRIHPLRPRRK